MASEPILARPLHRGDRRKMIDAVDALRCVPHEISIGDVADHQLCPRRDVLALARREIVEHAHPVAARQQRLDEMRSDETTSTRYEPARHQGSLPALRHELSWVKDHG